MSLQVCTAAQKASEAHLCDLQRTAKQGEQRSVQVDGIYSNGFEMGVLSDATCPSEHTWVELDLQSTANKEMLRSILDTAGQADVVFEGELYGPGIPDPKLPEAIRKSYQPGWGHLGAFRTKLVVHAILSVKPVGATDRPGRAYAREAHSEARWTGKAQRLIRSRSVSTTMLCKCLFETGSSRFRPKLPVP